MAPLIADDPGGTGRLSVCCGGRYCSGTDLDLVSGIGEVHECILFGNHGSSESSNPAAVDPVVRHRRNVQGVHHHHRSKAFLVFLFSVFTILYNTVTGAKECKKEYLKVAKVFKANRSQTVFLVIIPAALPSIFNGLKLAAATALTGVLFSEMQSARAGLGYLLTESQNLLNTPRMFFLIILITLLSVGAVKLIDAIEYAISYRWRHV